MDAVVAAPPRLRTGTREIRRSPRTKSSPNPPLPPAEQGARALLDPWISRRETPSTDQRRQHRPWRRRTAALFTLNSSRALHSPPPGEIHTLSTRRETRNPIPTSSRRWSDERRQRTGPAPARRMETRLRPLFASLSTVAEEGKAHLQHKFNHSTEIQSHCSNTFIQYHHLPDHL